MGGNFYAPDAANAQKLWGQKIGGAGMHADFGIRRLKRRQAIHDLGHQGSLR
jgi:hypothetical protein